MKEVIWVMGPSGVGKETFIKNIARNPKTLQLLNLESKSIVSCGASYHFNGNYEGDPIDEAREKIFDEIPDLLKNYDVVFVKWQHIDSERSRLVRLQKLLADVQHKTILLVAPKQELIERLTEKSWWHDFGNESAHVDSGINSVVSSVRELPSSITVRILESSKEKPYSLINNASDLTTLYYSAI